jgi:hypothetical protein
MKLLSVAEKDALKARLLALREGPSADLFRDVWQCTVGETQRHVLPDGADGPMRDAVAERFKELTGKWPDFIFSGWGRSLTESQRAVVDNREPEYEKTDFGIITEVAEALESAYVRISQLESEPDEATIVDVVFRDLNDRNGFDLGDIDEEIMAEWREELAAKIVAARKPADTP